MSESTRRQTEHRAQRPRRSALFMPASHPRALDKARNLAADALIFDLEDAVAPAAKAEARSRLSDALAAGGYGRRELTVRINPLASPWGQDDLAWAATLAIDAVVVPKVESAHDVSTVAAFLDTHARAPRHAIWPMVETPAGVLAAAAIAAADPRVAALVVGTSDLGKEMRVPDRPGRPGLLAALGACVLGARAAGVDVLDGVYLDLEDEPGFAAACAQGAELGFDGKTLIHPRQLAPCNRAFAPDPEDVEHARAVVHAWDGKDRGDGVVVVAGRLVENLHVEQAHRVIALADAIAALHDER